MSEMTETKSIDGLQLHQDMTHQRREWRVQRIAWVLMGLLMLAALLGLLGPGPLSHADVSAAALRVEYSRFEHMQAPGELRIELPADAVQAGTVRLRLNRGFVEQVDLERIDPEPRASAADSDGLIYEFDTRRSPGPVAVVVYYKYRTFGHMPVHVAMEGGPAVSFAQWVYP
jgi:hypothetical protein